MNDNRKVGIFIDDDKIFKNGCIQQPYFIFKSLKLLYGSNAYILSHSLNKLSFGNVDIQTRYIDSESDESDIDIIIFVSSTISNDDVYVKWKRQNVKLINLICGNWYVILQEDLVFDCHKRIENSIFHKQYDEIWLMPMYTFYKSWLEAISHKNVHIFPYIWDPEIIQKYISMKELKCKYILKPTKKYNLIIAEPNLSVHKTCLVPLAIAEKINTLYPDAINKIFILSKPKTDTFIKLVHKLTIGKKIEAYDRLVFSEILHQCNTHQENTIAICHQVLNSLNFMQLELSYLGFPFIHNCKPYSNIGYYYKDDNVDQAVQQFNSFKNKNELKKDDKDNVFNEYNYSNPIITNKISKLIDNVCNHSVRGR